MKICGKKKSILLSKIPLTATLTEANFSQFFDFYLEYQVHSTTFFRMPMPKNYISRMYLYFLST